MRACLHACVRVHLSRFLTRARACARVCVCVVPLFFSLALSSLPSYGAGGFPAWGIMPNSTLIFEIEVLSIK
jgi:hypothetical protein